MGEARCNVVDLDFEVGTAEIPPGPPLPKGGDCLFPPLERGVGGIYRDLKGFSESDLKSTVLCLRGPGGCLGGLRGPGDCERAKSDGLRSIGQFFKFVWGSSGV